MNTQSPPIGICCPLFPLYMKSPLLLSVMDVKAPTIGSEKTVTTTTPTINRKADLRKINHFGSSDSCGTFYLQTKIIIH